MAERPLTLKQKLFVEAYLGEAHGNATEAARIAGYEGNSKTLEAVGRQNLANTRIAALVAERVADAALTADEVLGLLKDHATSTMADFVDVDGPTWRLNLTKAEDAGKMHLIKSISSTKYGPRIELYDAQAAAVHLGRYHHLFTDKVDHGGKVVLEILRGAEADG